MNPTLIRSQPHMSKSSFRPRHAHALILGQSIILVLLLFGGLLYAEYELDALSITNVACWAVAAVTLYAFWSWRRIGGSFFDPYSLFLLSAVLFNASLAFLQVLGIGSGGILDGAFFAETTLGALYLVAVGLAAMHLGALLGVRGGRLPDFRCVVADPGTAQALRRTGWILLAISILPTVVLTARALTVVFRSGYFALYQQGAGAGIAVGPQILAGFLLPALLCLLAGSGGSPSYRILAVTMALIYSGVQLTLGARFGATAPLIALAWVWDRTVRPLPRRALFVVALAVIFLVFPVVGATRNIALVERGDLDLALETSVSGQGWLASAIAEFGGTIRTIMYTIDLVPSYRAFDYGLQYAYALLTIVPNIFGGVHPAVAHGTPSSWLIWTIDPATAAAGGGIGFSFIAEAYLNFGYLGTPIVLFLLGFLYVRFILWAVRSHDPARIAVLASFLSFFLVYPRGDSTALVRPLIWYSLLVYVLYLGLRSGKRAG